MYKRDKKRNVGRKRLANKSSNADRRVLLLLTLILLVFLTGKSFMDLREAPLEDAVITSVPETGTQVDGSGNFEPGQGPIFGTYERENWIHNLELEARNNSNAQLILDHQNDLSEPLLKLAGNNYDAIDFVAKTIDPNVAINFKYSEDLNDKQYPYYIQWDERWGYKEYAGGMIAETGCAPTAMAAVLTGLTGQRMTPDEMAVIATENGFSNNSGTSWNLFPYIAKEYGLKITEVANVDRQMKDHLAAGQPLIISVKPGRFTEVGHIMYITGVDSNGQYVLNDPNNLDHSTRRWNYEEFSEDLKAIWAFEKP